MFLEYMVLQLFCCSVFTIYATCNVICYLCYYYYYYIIIIIAFIQVFIIIYLK